MKLLVIAALAMTSCSGKKTTDAGPKVEPNVEPKAEARVIKDGLCVTKGAAAIGALVNEPTLRAVKLGSSGEAASLTFTFRGDTPTTRQLASGQERRQLGLKLRAQNGCNLVYVMWRLDPKPKLEVSVKSNPGAVTHEDCGTRGYTKLKPVEETPLPELTVGTTYTLRAAIEGDELRAWISKPRLCRGAQQCEALRSSIDDKLAWRGTLPDSVRAMTGPAGLRSDNLAFDLVAFDTPGGDTKVTPKCVAAEGD